MKRIRIEPLETRIAPAFVTGVLDLSSLSGSNGTQFSGGTAGDLTGQSVASAGDVNGDGLGDFIIGAPDSNGTKGGAYVVFGQFGGFAPEVALTGLAEFQGFALVGENVGDKAGVSVGSAGDFNGDGFDDILIGAQAADTNDGRLYVVFGKEFGFGTSVELSSLGDGSGLIIERTEADARLGRSVGRAGDFNGDGFDDLIVGAPTSYGYGDAFIYYGSENPTAGGLERTTLLGIASATQTGSSVSAAGDVNGDGIDDVIVGAKYANEGGTQRGAAYLVFGKTGAVRGTINLANLVPDGNGVLFSGTADNDYAGASVSGAGDVNGDGFADVIVGAYGADGQQFRGAAYVVFGSAAPVSLTLGALNGTNGFRVGQPVSGGGNPTVSDFLGYSVNVAGDVNGDGLDDVIIGAKSADPAGRSAAGQSFVVFGRTSAFPAILNPSTLTNFTGFVINGELAGDRSGAAVSAAGDVNGDTFADFLVGAPEASPNGAMSGQAYIVYGGPSGDLDTPGILLGGKTATFTDVDGDFVTVKVSKGTLTGSNFVLLKSSETAVGAQLLSLNLGAAFDGADVSITAKRVGGGDGKVNLGLLDAFNVDLGKVTVGGDLGGIFAGDATADGAITSLTVGSMGLFGGRTGDGIGVPFSFVTGGIGALKVAGDFAADFRIVRVSGAVGSGNAGSVLIGGSLIGGDTGFSGTFSAEDRVGSVTIKGDVRGGGGNDSGSLLLKDVGVLTIAGDVRGGAGQSSGVINLANAGPVKIGGDVRGGEGAFSGRVTAAKLGNITIGGSLIGGSGIVGGSIRSASSIGNVKIVGGQLAGSGSNTADIQAVGSIGKVAIGGDQIGDAFSSGRIRTTGPGANIASVTIGGDASAGETGDGGGIRATGQVGPVVIKGSVLGTPESLYRIQGGGVTSGFSSLAVKSVKIGGDFEHGVILGGSSVNNPDAQIGPVSVGGDWIGSSIAAGIVDATGSFVGYGTVGDQFRAGTNTDAVAFIQSVTIKGTARGTFALGDHYGIVAEHIGFVSIGGAKLPLTPAIASDLAGLAVGPTPDFIVRELSHTTPIPAPIVTPLPAAGPRSAWQADINLGSLSSGDGFTLTGAPGDGLGTFTSGAGDVNGDGFDDFIVTKGLANGEAYLIFGTSTGFPTVSELNGSNGFKLTSSTPSNGLGRPAAAGDVNGDGFDDVLISTLTADTGTYRGTVYVIFGRQDFSANGGSLNLESLSETEAIRIPGLADSDFLRSSAGAGDVNGDGFDDLWLGAKSAAEGGLQRGAAYLIFGGQSLELTNGEFDLGTLNGSNGFKVAGTQDRDFAGSVQSLGDINGDGFADLAVGNFGRGVRVILGAPDFAATGGTFDLAQLNGTNGFTVTTPAASGLYTAEGVGDVNGDGFDDFSVVELPPSTGDTRGRIYVVFGGASFAATQGTLPLGSIDGTNGFQFAGRATGDKLGSGAFGAAGDVNGDGFADLFATSPYAAAGGLRRGEAYVIFGKPDFSANAGLLDLEDLDGSLGFKIQGAEDDSRLAFTGARAGGRAGDVNGDGFADLILGSSRVSSGAGQAYVIFGGPSGEFIDPTFSADFRTATWTDVDGDLVTLKLSKGTLDAGNFKLLAKSTGDDRAQLLALNLPAEFDGADITLTAKRAGGGDGKVNLGHLNANGVDLGKVTISGDLGRIFVGDAVNDPALKSLTLGSLGVFGGLTQDTGGSLFSVVVGPVGAVKIAGDVKGAQFFAVNAATDGSGKIASLTVGGSIFGGSIRNSGFLGAAGSLGPVKIGGDIIGGSGFGSGYLFSASLTSLTIGGDLLGSASEEGGTVFIQGDAGKVSIGGSLIGGSGEKSGRLFIGGSLDSLKIGGSLIGGGGDASGQAVAGTSLGSVTIGGSQIGGSGDLSGSLDVNGSIGKITIKRDQIGGEGVASALIFARDPGSNIASVTIGGDARGGDADFSGGILAGGTLGPVSIKGNVFGTAERAYTIRGSGPLEGTKSVAIASVKVGGDFERAVILAGYGQDNVPTNGHAQIGAISVGGDWIASSVTAGLLANSVGFFGKGGEVFIPLPAAPDLDGVVASIASITIKGRAVGSLQVGDFFGIVAEQIGSVSIGGVKLPLTTNTDAGFAIGFTPDFIIREVARA